jgi:hypothetical protein
MTKPLSMLALPLALTLWALPGLADPSTSSKAAAEALYLQGTELVAAGSFAQACEKFEASQKLDPALGTMLRWADCLDRAGKTASAWALFREAAGVARGRGEGERERMAEQRASYLEANLSRLTLTSKKRPAQGLVVRVGGAPIPAASLNTPLPVDPGLTRIELSAPGHRDWSGTISVNTGPSQQEFTLPTLTLAPRPRAKPADRRSETQVELRPDTTYRTIGLITGSVGLLGIGGSVLLGLRAQDLGSESRAHCQTLDPNACDETGYDLREQALTFADAATISGAVGGALLVTGLGLVVFAPTRSTEVGARATTSGSRLELRGRF